ncbi:MAG TPA: DUF2950 domain-containing protein, partial [Steroidobacteraceae bacterium]|nr:DUF2950 domain-containing protein [Steroidobacteraceae bacterium]
MANRQERQPSGQSLLLALLLALCTAMGAVVVATAATSPAAQARFATPEEAVDALVSAARSGRTAVLARILGPAGASLIRSGDAVADRSARQRFVAAYDQHHRIELEGSAKAVLIVGAESWPMPIPLVHTASGWQFDTAAGREEILDRRIGRNELAVIQVCRAYVEAQREYAQLKVHSGGSVEYAQHFMSRGSAHNGLYWPTGSGEPQSPLGPLVAQARAGGYSPGRGRGKPHPYYGYYFRILTGQGANAPGGARSYLADGRMTRGFALLAYPD